MDAEIEDVEVSVPMTVRVYLPGATFRGPPPGGLLLDDPPQPGNPMVSTAKSSRHTVPRGFPGRHASTPANSNVASAAPNGARGQGDFGRRPFVTFVKAAVAALALWLIRAPAAAPQALELVLMVIVDVTAVEPETVAFGNEKQPFVSAGLLDIVHEIEPV